jgi:hypothetical protein
VSAQSPQRAVDYDVDVVSEGDGVNRRQVSPSGEESFCRDFRRDDRTKLCDAPAIACDRDPFATRDAIEDVTPVVAQVANRYVRHAFSVYHA